jgi:ribonuclease VapC
VIVETSALIAIVRREPERESFLAALDASPTNRISAASYVEAAIVVDATRDPVLSRYLDELLGASEIAIEPVTERQARIAREAYRDYGRGSGHPAGLNFGDCFAYALARDVGEPLLFKGADFRHTDVRPAI